VREGKVQLLRPKMDVSAVLAMLKRSTFARALIFVLMVFVRMRKI